MTKRAVDLSLEELAAMGAKAARQAVKEAQDEGLVVTGTVDFFDADQAVSSLAQLHPSGTVTLVANREDDPIKDDRAAAKPVRRTSRD